MLNPWPLLHRHVFPPERANPLCISYPFELEMDQLKFVSVEHYLLFGSTLNQFGMEKAMEIQRLRAIPRSALEDPEKTFWYVKVPDVLERVLAEKYKVCQKFREALHAVEYEEIIYASKERYLACGMEYSLVVLTDSSHLPGRNMLGESLSALKKENQA